MYNVQYVDTVCKWCCFFICANPADLRAINKSSQVKKIESLSLEWGGGWGGGNVEGK
jgi:hypothetical protein